MDAADIVKAYFEAGERGDWITFAGFLDDDFVFTAVPVTQNKAELLSSTRALWGAFPDLKFNFRARSVENNVVKGTYQITGTHTGLLIPPMQDQFVAFPPTGKYISLPQAEIEMTLRGDKIIRQKNEPKGESSWPGIFEQIGEENPYS